MPFHVGLWKFDADGEALDDEDDAGAFEGDLVGVAPLEGIEEVGGMRTEDDADDGGNSGLTDVQLLLDEEGAEHEQAGEAADDEVRQMRLVDGQLVPSHCEEVLIPAKGGLVFLARCLKGLYAPVQSFSGGDFVDGSMTIHVERGRCRCKCMDWSFETRTADLSEGPPWERRRNGR